MGIENHSNYTAIQTLIQEMITKIGNKQADYFANKGKYFQGLQIPSQVCDGSINISIDPTLHPTDQLDDWMVFDSQTFKMDIKFPVQIKLDVYESPVGWGWILMIELLKAGLGSDKYGNDGDHWLYQHNKGPEFRIGIWDDWFITKEELLIGK